VKIASFVIEAIDSSGEELKKFLSNIEGISIYGEKDNSYVVVFECESLNNVESFFKEISKNELVKAVLPVYISEL